MIRLPSAALAALRARLATLGARPSISPLVGDGGAELDAAIVEELAPLADAMVLMMAADGELGAAERDVVRGALRELDDRVRARHVEALVHGSREALEQLGTAGLAASIARTIGADVARAEVALVLAAAVAYADGEIADAEDEAMASLMSALGVAPERMRALLSALERVDSVLLRDAKADPADVFVHAALHLRTAEDFERLAARGARPDVALPLRLYGAYVHALDEILDTTIEPASIPAAATGALGRLAERLPQHRTPRLDRLRASLAGLAAALELVVKASSTAELRSSHALGQLDASAAELSSFAAKALLRVGAGERHACPEGGFLELDATGDRASLVTRLSALLERLAPTVPAAVLTTMARALERLSSLPADAGGTAAAPDLLPAWVPRSRVLGGFTLVAPIGRGGFGSVFVATRVGDDAASAERLALKVPAYDALAAESVSESEYLSVFKREAGALLAVPEHPNLAAFVTFDARSRPKPALVMELVDGEDCQALVRRRALDVPSALRALDGVCAGLAAMHGVGVGHLDLKPSNVVVRPDGVAKLVDFGLSGRQIRVGCATPGYASPEVWGVVDGGTPLTADVYSLACVAYELLVGAPLFGGSSAVAAFSEHTAHDGRPDGVRALEGSASTRPLAAWLAAGLRRAPAARLDIGAFHADLSAVARALDGASWPITKDSR